MTVSQVSFGSHEAVLDVKNLTVKYIGDTRSTTAVDNVSFSIGVGEVFGLAGESGCGKSTIANSIMRLLKDPAKIAAGSISFGGKDVLAMSQDELRRFRWQDVAMVFQSAMNSLNPVLTIGEQMADIFTTHAGYSRKESLRRAAQLLELVRIDPARLQVLPAPALRRDAAARRHRHGRSTEAIAADPGRADHRAGRGGAAGDHGPDQGPPARTGLLRPVHHPRHVPDGGTLAPHGRHVRRPDRGDRKSPRHLHHARGTPTPGP